MAKLTDNQKSMLTLGVGALAAIGFGVLIYFDLEQKKEYEEQTAQFQAQKATNDAKIAKIPGLEKDLVAYKRIVLDNSKILPTEDEIHAFARDVSALEKELGFTMKSVPVYKPEQWPKVASITKIPLKMQISASSRAFLRFLNILENRDRLVSVTDFKINPSPDEPRPGQELEHEVSLSFDLYRYDPKAGPQGAFPISDAKFDTLLGSKEVKDILAAKGKPASLERYQLLPGRDNRRDPFVDPRRRTDTTGAGSAEGKRGEEETRIEALRLKLERLRLDLESYRNAEKEKDFLRMAASKRNFLQARQELEDEIRTISQQQPEFTSRDLQERYQSEVRQPYVRLMAEAQDLGTEAGPGGVTVKVTAEMAAGMRKDLEGLVAQRKFQEASEKWVGIESLVRDAFTAKTVEDAARPHIDAMRQVGEHAKFQHILHSKKIDVQGVVRMEKSSAVIINGRTLFPGKAFDKDVRFVRVDPGAKGEADRIVFSIDGHEVEYMQPKPALLQSERALLQQD